jgi:ATPase subunit of ABC transporter with duplicated ATPase domains
LDAESVLWLEQHLAQYAGTVIAVTHDRYFDNVAGWILELDRGRYSLEGNYSSWLDQKSSRMALEEKVAKHVEKLRTRVGLGSSRAKDVKRSKSTFAELR